MLVTEEEAKERWCPFARAPGRMLGRRENGDSMDVVGFCPQNRGYATGVPLDNCRCIASQCMAWRWQPLQADQPFMDAVKARMEEAGEPMSKATKYVRAHLAELGLPDKPYRGICGLAGTLLK